MAIYGAGSKWGNNELKQDFFDNDRYVIGWNQADANDLYSLISSIKAGDLIYLKSNQPGSLDIKIKGIGIVRNTLIHTLFHGETNLSTTRSNFHLPVTWVVKNEFKINVPFGIGKLTNIRAATLYEEPLPYIQNSIIDKLLDNI